MTTSYRAVFIILFAILPFAALAQKSSIDSQTKIINQIIDKSGIASQVSQSPKEMKSQFESNPLGLEPFKNKRMIDLFAKAFVVDSLIDDVQNTFKEQYNADFAGVTYSWLREESTQKVMEAEKEFHTLQGSRQRIVRMYELEQNPPSEERKNIIQSLIAATSAKESAIKSQTILFRSIISAFSILSDQQTFNESQIDGIVNNYRLQMQSQIEQEIANQLLIMYYELDNKILNEYTAFYQTEPGNWLSTTTSKGIHAAFNSAAKRFVKSVNSFQ